MSDNNAMLTIREIPRRDLDRLSMLSNLDDGDATLLAEACRAANPCLSMRKFIGGVTKSLPEGKRKDAGAMAETFFNMQVARIRLGVTADEFIAAIFSSENIGELKLTPEKMENCRDRLGRILAIDSLFITAKAASVLTAHEHPFESARIFTDVRPIFGDAVAGTDAVKPQAAVLVHNLKLRLGGEESERELYVAMDNRDLQTLIDALNRAKAKAAELSEFVKRGGLSYLEP